MKSYTLTVKNTIGGDLFTVHQFGFNAADAKDRFMDSKSWRCYFVIINVI